MQRPRDRLVDLGVVGLAAVLVTGVIVLLGQAGLGSSWWVRLLVLATVFAGLLGYSGVQQWRRDLRRRRARLDRLAVRQPVSRVDPAGDLHVVSRERLRADHAPYVGRLVDAELRRKLRGERFVLVVGKSKAGKSRTAYEAARAALGGRLLVAPREARRDTLEQVFRQLGAWDRRRGVVLWLDELDKYVTARALTVQFLEELGERAGEVVILATMRESAYHRLVHPSLGGGRAPRQEAGHQAGAVLEWADTVFLSDRLEGAEILRAGELYPGYDWSRLSLGATLAHGPQLVDRFRTAAEAIPHGVACVSAAIDWRRAGVTRPIRRSELRDLHHVYLEQLAPRRSARTRDFEEALRWALEPLPGSDVRLLYPRQLDDGESVYEPDDYVLAQRDAQEGPVREAALTEIVALPTVTPEEALQVGFTAMLSGSLATALEVYEAIGARCSDGEREVAAWAACGRADVLGRLDRLPEAIALCDEVVARFGGSEERPLQRPVAWALVNKGVRLGEQGRDWEEIAAYDEVVWRFGSTADADAALREQVAVALCNKGAAFARLGELEEAIAPYDEVVGRYQEAEQPGLREQVVQALHHKALTLEQLDRPHEAIAVYDVVLARLRDSSLASEVAAVLYRKAVALGSLGRAQEAIALYDELVDRFGDAADPDLRELVAWALYNRAVRVGSLGRTRDEIAAYDRLVRRFDQDDHPGAREAVACALLNKAAALARLRSTSQEIAVYEEVERRFGGTTDPGLRQVLAAARYNRGVALSLRGKSSEAAAAYDEVVVQFADPSGGGLTGVGAMAHFSREIVRKQLRTGPPARGPR